MQRFGELLRKLWNPRSFKSHVSPHEMLQVRLPSCWSANATLCPMGCVSECPTHCFTYVGCLHCQQEEVQDHRTRSAILLNYATLQPLPATVILLPWPYLSTGDPVEFLSWLLNTLHLALGGSKKAHSSKSSTAVP